MGAHSNLILIWWLHYGTGEHYCFMHMFSGFYCFYRFDDLMHVGVSYVRDSSITLWVSDKVCSIAIIRGC